MNDPLFVALLADYTIIPIIILGGWALLKIPAGQRYQAYSRIIMTGLTAFLLAKFASLLFQPEVARPYVLLGVAAGATHIDNPGFPSDHALFTTVLVAAVWFEARRRLLAAVLAAIVVLVCLGRVLALVHTPLDVVAGVVIGLLASAFWYWRRDIGSSVGTK